MTRARDNATQGGLVLLTPGSSTGTIGATGGISFTTASTVSVNNVFNSTYQNYKVEINLSAKSTDGEFYIRLRANGTDTSTNYVYGGAKLAANGIVYGYGGSSTAIIIGFSNVEATSYSLTIYSPNEARLTNMGIVGWGGDSSNGYTVTGGGKQTASTQFDGFTIFPPSGTISGTIRVYGIKN